MVIDALISVLIFLVQHLLLPILPTNIVFFPIATFTSLLDALKTNLIFALSGLGTIISIDLIFTLILVVIFAEISLFAFKIGVFVMNLLRGSGA